MSPRVRSFVRAAMCGVAIFPQALPQIVRADGLSGQRLEAELPLAYAADENADDGIVAEPVGDIRLVNQPAPVTQPEEPVQAAPASDAPGAADNGNVFGGFADLGSLSSERAAAAGGGSTASDVVTGAESEVRNTADTSDLLVRSLSSTGLYVHSRNPISNDLRIRGFRFSQIRNHVHGAF